MRILDRYIVGSTLRIILGCVIVFSFLYIIIDIFNHLDEIMKQKIDLFSLLDYYLSYLPIIFVQVIPMGCLLATLYVLGSLSRHNEIIALRSSGLTILEITKGIIFLSIVISMFVFVINENFVPYSLEKSQQLKTSMFNISKKQPQQDITNLCIYGLKNRLFFINNFSLKNNTLLGITILEEDKNQNIIRKIVATKGTWINDKWVFSDVIIYNFDQKGQLKGGLEYYPEQVMDIPETPQDFLKQKKDPQTMNIWQLKNYILRLLNSSAKTVARNLKVDLYHRIFFPFSSLVLTILAIPFALRIKARLDTLSSLGFSLGLGFLYYVIDAVSVALGKTGFFLPFISAGFSFLIFLSLGLYLIWKT